MSAVEEAQNSQTGNVTAPKPTSTNAVPVLNRVLDFLSSVRFGVFQLMIVILLALIGMIIVQQNVEGFDKYYATLTPSQKMLYGGLGMFDVYHAWYFHLLLLTLSLNIILASIDRAPITWRIIKGRKLTASRVWLNAQQATGTVSIASLNGEAARDRVVGALKRFGFKSTVTEQAGKTYVFAERGAWNRLTYLAVHVALLTIFTGGFLTAQFSRDGNMPLSPGEAANQVSQLSFGLNTVSEVQVAIPFTVECTDIQQKLIKLDGPITADNTVDWSTTVKIKDEYGETNAVVSLNKPYDYRGYRFFQASFIDLGNARTVTLLVTPERGGAAQTVVVPRNGSTTLADGTRLDLKSFQPDFTLTDGQPDTKSGEYNNPAAVLQVTSPSGEAKRAFAFKSLPEGAPVGNAVLGYKYKLINFERASFKHVLALSKDPGKTFVYLGFFGLIGTLCAVFFFSHQRIWALIEPKNADDSQSPANEYDVVMGGNTNRSKMGFEDRFHKIEDAITGNNQEVQS
ncbi:MAG: cytochrome c biogenesis protein ResB [Pyrinomonadaceae bacterium]